ncbi:MAG TPA: hypothetical protein VFJ71_09775 [Candidatus Limnocylindrales bacterium]|nr:hypothetical protein [Candidatus Limnocylindrales bacterium]
MRRLLIGCYPARWRARYGDEFAAVLDERPLGPFDVADILLGALDAHLHLRGLGAASEHQRGFAMSRRIGGVAAIVGGLSWMVALIGSSGSIDSSPLWVALFVAGNVGLLVALIGLSAFQARSHPTLVWAAFAIPAIGGLLSTAGILGMIFVGDRDLVAGWSPWGIWALGTVGLIGGSALFAIATLRTRALSRVAATVLLVGSLMVVPMLGIGASGAAGPATAEIVLTALVVVFGAGWAWLGASAVRADRGGIPARPGAALP